MEGTEFICWRWEQHFGKDSGNFLKTYTNICPTFQHVFTLEKQRCLQRALCVTAHSGSVCNSQKLARRTPTLINRYTEAETVVYEVMQSKRSWHRLGLTCSRVIRLSQEACLQSMIPFRGSSQTYKLVYGARMQISLVYRGSSRPARVHSETTNKQQVWLG